MIYSGPCGLPHLQVQLGNLLRKCQTFWGTLFFCEWTYVQRHGGRVKLQQVSIHSASPSKTIHQVNVHLISLNRQFNFQRNVAQHRFRGPLSLRNMTSGMSGSTHFEDANQQGDRAKATSGHRAAGPDARCFQDLIRHRGYSRNVIARELLSFGMYTPTAYSEACGIPNFASKGTRLAVFYCSLLWQGRDNILYIFTLTIRTAALSLDAA